MIARMFAVTSTLLAATAAHAETKHYDIDPVHTRVLFIGKHMSFSHAIGTFARPTGAFEFDEKDWASAKVDVTIAIDTLDLGDAGWRERMLRRDFFNLDKFPQARFVSTRVEGIDATHARVTGTLTLRGKQAPLVLRVTLNDVARHPYTFRNTAGFSATATLKRSDFGMISLPNVVADEVELRIEVEGTRARDEEKDR